jgi:hypothetical protein
LTSDASGEVFNLVPPATKPEPAQLGIRLVDATGGVQHLRSDVSVRPSDSGLTSTIRGIPNTLNGLPLHINSISLTLLAKSGSGKSFMTNPTSCDPAVTTLKVVGDSDGVAQGTDNFTPTACDALPFAPTLSATVGSKGFTGARSMPPLTTIIEQQPGESPAKSAKVTLAAPLSPNVGALANVCSIADFNADGCPASSIVGQAEAVTPLLASPLKGPVRIVESGGNSLPKLVLYLNGLINIRLVGDIGLEGTGTTTTFAGIPDVPLSRFKLDFVGGPTGLVGTLEDLCKKAPVLSGDFRSHSGKAVSVTTTATVKGCPAGSGGPVPPRPLASVSLRRLATTSPLLQVSARRRSSAGKRLRAISVTLPGPLSFDRGTLSVGLKAAKGLKASLSGKHVLALRTKSAAGAATIGALVSKGALRVSSGLRGRVAKHPKVTVTVRVTEVGGRVTTLRKSVTVR